MSQADASLIRDALLDAGHREAAPEAAEIHVVNTCALTLEAERKSRQQVNRGARRGRTFVSGCAVNLNAGQFAADRVTVLPGSADRAAREIVDLLGGGRGTACADDAPRLPGRTRAFVKVQNGCDSACSFCIIPTTRGRAESRPLARILADARRRIDEGHPELVVTGINVGTYRDPRGGADLADLVRALGRLDGLARLRVSSIEPNSLDERFLAAMAETPTAAPHLHVPLQSGDDGVLRAMRRRYSADAYRAAAERARAALPGLNLTTDAIVGFPGESEEAFAATARMAEELGMSKVHVFSYSPRPGTDAAMADDAVTAEAKKERSRRLRDLSDRLGFAHRLGRVGGRDAVLVEKRLEDGTLTGLGADYSRFVLPAGAGEPGDLVPVEVAGLAGEHLEGRPRG
ncbi:MAG: threonylcarbamoyladenosine tRNA methylthiotransferase MtaB [Miltoncostaeaceae bacterium]|nr:threonylcarbamoyladenosine tRNA methylthiotransferase MtaB [Miltoncostaeaceae bacterium]